MDYYRPWLTCIIIHVDIVIAFVIVINVIVNLLHVTLSLLLDCPRPGSCHFQFHSYGAYQCCCHRELLLLSLLLFLILYFTRAEGTESRFRLCAIF